MPHSQRCERFTPRQSAFYTRVTRIIDQNLMNPNLTVSWLSEQTGLSRSQLFRRIKALTGHSVSSLIRARRISQARRLISEAPMTVEEIALKTGFRSAQYFSRCFKDICHMTPTAYLKRQY